jgi:general secretion pathway protein D
MHRSLKVVLCVGLGMLAAGCPKGKTDYNQGRKAETVQDFDAALAYYEKALKSDPNNANFKIKINQLRFEASELHIKNGLAARKKDDLQGAAAEFQRALAIDPSSPIADQELRKTVETIEERNRAADAAAQQQLGPTEDNLVAAPPELKPLLSGPINLKMSNDAKIALDTIGKLAGITIIYDPDFPARRITVDLNNETLRQALDIVCFQSKAFWKPLTENTIFIVPDQPQKRRDYEEQEIRTFYLSNTVQAQDLTEIVTGLRQLLDLKRIQQVNAQNAIIIRDSPDKLAIAEKMIRDIDKAKPEVVIQVEVLQARTDRMRNLGITPGQTGSFSINPNTSTTSGSGTSGSSTTTNNTTISTLKNLTNSDFQVTLPSFTANAVLTDTFTKIIQNPEIRSIDGQPAKLKIGDRIPVATGSFSSGIGVTGGAAAGINPLVNTQFTYLDVGVNVDVTPRVHPNREVSMKVEIEVSSQTGTATIGGIDQPIISQRKITHDIRLREGEVSVLAGLFERTETRTLNGWPGLAKIPILRYLFSSDNTDHEENEVLIVLIPRIVRMPEFSKANLRTLFVGSEANTQVKHESEVRTPVLQPQPNPAAPQQQPVNQGPQGAVMPGGQPGQPGQLGAPTATAGAPGGQAAKIRFEPPSVSLKVGETRTIALAVDNVTDLFSIPLLLQYNPAVVSIEDVQHAAGEGGHGGFLSGGTQEVAIVWRPDKEHGQAIISATRQPNTPGVSGSGTILGIVVKGLAPGAANLSIVQVNAKDSQQKAIPLVSSEGTVQVQP